MCRQFMTRHSDPVGSTPFSQPEGRRLRSRSGFRLFPCLLFTLPSGECCSSTLKIGCDLTARFSRFRQVSVIKVLEVKITS
jgi:hypothetical protein